ncbi:NUDIX hydrolase [Streptacidiphilus sp. EB129]|uniref:NUDIX hydrolase n=1 Tax=Streptacidiphilus sp. EB129 TaxID=3156262 RepID=UPI0035180F5F
MTTATVLATLTVPWIRPPHRMDLLRSAEVPKSHVVTTAFALVLDAEERTLLTRVDRPGRGWEVPGGHLDPGERPVAAAVRELAEETGLRLQPSQLTLMGGQQITLLGPPPADYGYPGRAFMAFHLARLDHRGLPTEPDPGSECAEADWFARDEVAHRCAGAAWLPLHSSLFD